MNPSLPVQFHRLQQTNTNLNISCLKLLTERSLGIITKEDAIQYLNIFWRKSFCSDCGVKTLYIYILLQNCEYLNNFTEYSKY